MRVGCDDARLDKRVRLDTGVLGPVQANVKRYPVALELMKLHSVLSSFSLFHRMCVQPHCPAPLVQHADELNFAGRWIQWMDRARTGF